MVKGLGVDKWGVVQAVNAKDSHMRLGVKVE